VFSSNGKNPVSTFRRSATRSGPPWVARSPARKKQPRTVAPVVSVRAASARRFSTRNSETSDTSALGIGRRAGIRYIFCRETVMGFTPTETIWFNGKLIPWGEAKVHVLAHGLQYGTGVFEGMKSYPTADGPAIFRLDAHLERFFKSAELYDLAIPYSQTTLAEASLETVRANKLEAAYLRPVAFFDAATLSVWTKECPVTVAIAALPTGKYLANADSGVRVTVSPIRKFDNSAMPAWAKACGQYINSARAVNEAQRRGFDEALLLNTQG